MPAGARLPRLDALRGLAIVWMAGFHVCFDLVYFGFIRQNFYTDPFWTVQRACIVSLFLLCAGMGQAIALHARLPGDGGFDRRFLRRWAQIACCAVAVSIGSWLMFPHSFISFGVLHFNAVALLIVRATLPAGRWLGGGVGRRLGRALGPGLWLAAAVFLLAPRFIAHPVFDRRWSNWIGLVTTKPIAEDYVPLLPWLAAVCAGLAIGRWLLRRRPAWLAGPLPRPLAPLAALGRWSLTFYMLHQPILIGLLAAVVWSRRS